VITLFAVAAVAGASALTAFAVADPGPGRDAAVPAGDRPSPTPRARSERDAGPPTCVIGSWYAVEEQLMVEFYTDAEPMRFTGSGRRYEFRPDGTGTERQDNVILTSTHEGNELRIVGNGTVEFTWSATDQRITYLARTATTLTWSYYDRRGLLSTQPQTVEPALNEVDDYTCRGNRATESNAGGYSANWVRTDATGMYG